MVKLIKAETNNVEECIVAEANNIKINEYEVKKIKTGHMITAVHTCN